GLPRDPEVPATVNWWKGPLKLAGNIMMMGGVALALLHYLKFGPMELVEEKRRGAPGEKRRKTKE
ncbi:MAG TPA: formate dehydrogenase N subunit beta transmembrane domain-containing protein, partial [Candidatus Hypogeohydataceae bacterium YC38]